MTDLRCSIVIPAKNEGEKILIALSRLEDAISFPFECLVIVDSEIDPTIPAVVDFHNEYNQFTCLVNTGVKGPSGAIKFGINKAKAPIVVVTMSDGSDDPRVIPDLIRLIERGVDIACASRYMPGGQQIGAPLIKSILSRIAGKSLSNFRRVGTRDATNSFKAYNKVFLEKVGIESKYGFEMGLELVAKAKRYGYRVAELPTIWIERDFGESNFKLMKWLPRYLYWYFYAFGPKRKENKNA